MAGLADLLLMLVLLLGLAALGYNKVAGSIRIVALQGLVLGVLLLVANEGEVSPRLAFLALANAGLKGLVIPWALFRSMGEAKVRRDVQPYAGFTLSLLLGGAAIALGFWIARLLPPTGLTGPSLIAPVSLATVLIGLLLLVTRKLAIGQVIGYLVLENGVFVFGLALAVELPLLVELGVLLDLFVAAFIMGIIIFQINREFDHIDSSRLRSLQDLGARRPRAPRIRPPADRDIPPAAEL